MNPKQLIMLNNSRACQDFHEISKEASCDICLWYFSGQPGRYVDLKDTIDGFKGILEGKYDHLPEMAFYMVGDINEVSEKADTLAKELAAN